MSRLPKLQVSSENPYLLSTDRGAPFFMLGDTAWELFHRLTRNEAEYYFRERAKQGFNMVWATALAEFDGLRTPNANGDLPFYDLDPSQPNKAYFDFVVDLVRLAQQYGIYVGLLPTWADKVTPNWGAGPVVFPLEDVEIAESYTRYLGERLAGFDNILWVLGGDRPAKLIKDGDVVTDWTPIWRAMAKGIFDGYGSKALITYHPQGGKESTSQFLHQESWLHLNAMQSGHGGGRDTLVWDLIERDRSLTPSKPTFDSEPNYEDHPVSPWPTFDPRNGYFDEYDVRRQNYRSVFAGGCGVIYGHHSIWQFASEPKNWVNHAKMDWRQALHRPGAEQMGHLRALMETRDYFKRVPDQSVIVGEIGAGPEHRTAIRCEKGSHLFVYLPHGGSITVDTSSLLKGGRQVSWFDPRSGLTTPAEATREGQTLTAVPPNDIDWVLIVEAITS